MNLSKRSLCHASRNALGRGCEGHVNRTVQSPVQDSTATERGTMMSQLIVIPKMVPAGCDHTSFHHRCHHWVHLLSTCSE